MVRELSQDLRDLGHTVWMDQQLTGGQEWWDLILTEIRACDVFVTVLTESFLKSEACRTEYHYALALHKTLLPVRLNDQIDLDRISPELLKRQIVDYGGGNKAGILSLHKSLAAIDVSGALPDPLPEPPDVPISYLARILDEISQPEVLSYDQQFSFLYRLRDHLRETGNAVDVKKALNELGRRKDLYARVKEEMTVLLQEVEQAQNTTSQDAARQSATAKDTTTQNPQRKPAMNAGEPAASNSSQSARTNDKGAGGIVILCFLIPLIGLIMYLVWKENRPKSSKQAGIAAIIGAVFYLFINIISNATY